MVTGKFPFEGSTVYTLFENIAKAEYNIPDWVDANLAALIGSMLELDKDRRPTIPELKKHEYVCVLYVCMCVCVVCVYVCMCCMCVWGKLTMNL